MDEYWIWLSQIKGLGTVTQKKLINGLGDPSTIYLADKQDLKSLYGIREDVVENIISSRSLKKAYIILEKTIKANIKMITYDDPLLPISVRKNKNTPIILYYLGSIRQDSMGVGIVGARRCTSYGKQVAKEAAAYLAREGITVISGMAKGIDGYAHTACIQEGGYTIALLGGGVDICYPAEHKELMMKIIDMGAVISPFPPGTQPLPRNFVIRNKLMSEWCNKILVVEASEKSGALTTAEYAIKQNKMVFAVPNSIYIKESKGTNRLIYEGAHIYLEPGQLLLNQKCDMNSLLLKKKELKKNSIELGEVNLRAPEEPVSKLESEIYQLIMSGINNTDVLLQSVDEDRTTVLEALCSLELKQKIRILPGGMIEARTSQGYRGNC